MSQDSHASHSDTGEKEKFSVDQAEFSLDSANTLPEYYGDNRLVGLARDPFCAFAYWEINEENAQRVRREGGQDVWETATLVLRVYEVSAPGANGIESCPSFDISLRHDAKSWYVHFSKSGGAYVMDLGLRRSDGRFFSLCRSNRFQLPAGRVSDETDSQFAAVSVSHGETVNDPFNLLTQGLDRIGKGSADFSKSMAQRWEFLRSVFSGSHVSSWSMPSSSNMPSSGKTSEKTTEGKP